MIIIVSMKIMLINIEHVLIKIIKTWYQLTGTNMKKLTMQLYVLKQPFSNVKIFIWLILFFKDR